MATTINHATLARQVNGEIQYIYPKTDAELIEYDSSQNIKEKIDNVETTIREDTRKALTTKVDKPLDEDENAYNGTAGQVLETNGDGSTSWVTRPRVYVGSDVMPEGYDIKLDPDKVNTNIDKTLTAEGSAADAKAVGDAIDNINNNTNNSMAKKVNIPLDENGEIKNGDSGQVLETNGDGSTSWVTRARVYVGTDEMPEGYDVQIDPSATAIEIDRTLSIDGGIAEASSTGAAIQVIKNKITTDIAAHNKDVASHVDIRAMITDAKDYILMKDQATGEELKVSIVNGQWSITSAIPKVVSITITAQPTKTSYNVGDYFDPTGMVVTASYTDGVTKEITGYTYSTMKLTANTTSIAIAYIEAGITVETTVAVTMIVECIGINIAAYPSKTQYVVGQSFNPTGMIIGATYSDGTTTAITNYTYSTATLTSGITHVTVSYTEDENTFTVNVPITVIAKTCTGISITSAPTKTQYTEGETFSPTGMVVTASYNDGTSNTVTNYTYSTAALTTETNSMVISYIENGTSFTTSTPITIVSVFNPAVTLQDFTYISNSDGTYTITGWKGTKNGVTSTEVVVPDSSYIIVNPSE